MFVVAAVQLDSNLEQRLVLGTDDVSTVEWDTLSYYGNVIVSIKDSGFGMTKANLDSLFQEGLLYICTIDILCHASSGFFSSQTDVINNNAYSHYGVYLRTCFHRCSI